MSVEELIKLKNIDLYITQYNHEAKILNKDGFIDKNAPHVKKLKSRYEGIMARFDTNNTIKKGVGSYILPHKITNKLILGIKGVTKDILVR